MVCLLMHNRQTDEQIEFRLDAFMLKVEMFSCLSLILAKKTTLTLKCYGLTDRQT